MPESFHTRTRLKAIANLIITEFNLKPYDYRVVLVTYKDRPNTSKDYSKFFEELLALSGGMLMLSKFSEDIWQSIPAIFKNGSVKSVLV